MPNEVVVPELLRRAVEEVFPVSAPTVEELALGRVVRALIEVGSKDLADLLLATTDDPIAVTLAMLDCAAI